MNCRHCLFGTLFVAAALGMLYGSDAKPNSCEGVIPADDPLYDLLDGCMVLKCDTTLQNTTFQKNGSDDDKKIGAPFGRCLIAADLDNGFPKPRASGCNTDDYMYSSPSRCFYKNEFYAQCVPEDRVVDEKKPRFVITDDQELIEIVCEDDDREVVDADAPTEDAEEECLDLGDMCDEGMGQCCNDLDCYPADDSYFCLECPVDFPLTYKQCLGDDVEGTAAEGKCCQDSDECVIGDPNYYGAEMYGACRPKDESCCERVTFNLRDRTYRCPRSRDLDFVPGPCNEDSSEYSKYWELITNHILNTP